MKILFLAVLTLSHFARHDGQIAERTQDLVDMQEKLPAMPTRSVLDLWSTNIVVVTLWRRNMANSTSCEFWSRQEAGPLTFHLTNYHQEEGAMVTVSTRRLKGLIVK